MPIASKTARTVLCVPFLATLLFAGTASTSAMAKEAAKEAPLTLVRGNDPKVLQTLVQSLGYQANLEKTKDGRPYITSALSGDKFLIFFNNCTDDFKNCQTLQYYAGWSMKEQPVSLTRINDWNRDHAFGRAYIDGEGDPVVEMDLNMEPGGVPKALFLDTFNLWTKIMPAFAEHVKKSS